MSKLINYFLGTEIFFSEKNLLEKIVDIGLGKIIPNITLLGGITYGYISREPHTPGNIVLAGELWRLMYFRLIN
ncbi:hypothetical protein HZA97_00145 [Candidatus Woesearchaeota archaeon]|nr:hypothetical protein [Candidatus Woesearchaeota archaeon]